MFDKRTDARVWLNGKLAEVAAGRTADAGALTVADYLTTWIDGLGMQQLEAATISWYRTRWSDTSSRCSAP